MCPETRGKRDTANENKQRVRVLEAEKLVIVDRHGNRRAELSVIEGDGAQGTRPELRLWNERGEVALALSGFSIDGGGPGLDVYGDRDDRASLGVSVNGPHVDLEHDPELERQRKAERDDSNETE